MIDLGEPSDRNLRGVVDFDGVIAPLMSTTRNIPGDVAELGVGRGDTFVRIAEQAYIQKKQCHAFDSFRGLGEPGPHDNAARYPRGKFDFGGPKKLLSKLGPLKQHVTIWEGWIPAVFERVPADVRFSFVHLDLDHYEPTMAALKWLWPRMSPGGILLCHDCTGKDSMASGAIQLWSRTSGNPPDGQCGIHAWFRKEHTVLETIIFEQVRLAWIMVPKCASLSIRHALQVLIDGKRGREETLPLPWNKVSSPRLTGPEYDGWLTFGVVRNPWERLVSAYVDKIENRSPIFNSFAKLGFGEDWTFEQFARHACQLSDEQTDHHIQSIWSLLTHQGRLLPKCILRTEMLCRDWPIIQCWCAGSGVEIEPLPRSHTSGAKPYMEYYTPELAQIVGARYTEDATHFGYYYGLNE